MKPEQDGINTYREGALHLALKRWYARPGDRLEADVEGCVVDLVRDDLLVEIQTGSFAALKPKLARLLPVYRVRIVHPVPAERWIVKLDAAGKSVVSRRRSPMRGHVTHLFRHLIYLGDFMLHPNLSYEVLLVRDEEIRRDDGRGSWRRKGWSIQDRRLLDVLDAVSLETAADFRGLLPGDLPQPFTTADLASGLKQRRAVAQKMAYCLRHMAIIEIVDRQRDGYRYRVV
ncbi:MAG: hypothetical protein ACOCZH_05745 [Phototrophicaceae bacterium]